MLRGGDDLPEVPLTTDAEVIHMYGATLGLNWAGFPAIATRDYNGPEMLLVELPIYIDWELHINGCPAVAPNPSSINPPRPIAQEAWFVGNHTQFELTDAPWLDAGDLDYNPCPAGLGIEEPAPAPLGHVYPVGADGTIRIRDVHGGTAADSRFVLRYATGVEQYIILFRWNRPQSYTHIATGVRMDATPGSAVPRPQAIPVRRTNGNACGVYNMWTTVLIVEHVSTDASNVSPGYVDASDLGAMAQRLGQAVKWGHDADGGPGARTFHVNFTPFGSSALVIDSADAAKLAQELESWCMLSKAATDERVAIMDWFGMVATGREVQTGANGETSPEYGFEDPIRLARAIADPYGYRQSTAAQAVPTPWGHVKALYR